MGRKLAGEEEGQCIGLGGHGDVCLWNYLLLLVLSWTEGGVCSMHKFDHIQREVNLVRCYVLMKA